ncbi:uncharacterized protein C8Q71DRAFT_890293 [Rhodofomes roseus]|uniref:Homeobox domain-containing protein n=1 Tax=Rhodofomes roseus TaxID=34475 RepID=A0ABQ8KQT3_9APHY|nr:uncharacterized protein C8Q71DRAFT_890293 [Rhodofomes roseus]KAH9840979.1 hypothetical protein C8Q71DRAFT_890293 [Rhodofomes roseus]
MPARRWTTDAELEYLQTKLDSFRSHQLAHTLHRFWPDIYREWFLKFPERPRVLPNVDGDLSEAEDKQLQEAIINRKRKVYNWFNNQNCQQTRKAKATHVNLSLLKPKNRRNLKETEVYSRKYYDERIKPQVQEELSGRVVTKEERLGIIKRVTKELYDREDEEIKKEIRDEVDVLRAARGTPGKRGASEGTDGSDAPAEATDEHAILAVVCQSVLDDMPAIFRQLFLELHRQTGWYFMVMAAGVAPGSDGGIGSMVFHQEGDDPEHNIGRLSNFVSQFVRPFVEYVKEEIAIARSEKLSQPSTSSPAPAAAPQGPAAPATPATSTQEASGAPQATSSVESSEQVGLEQSPSTSTAPTTPAASGASSQKEQAAPTVTSLAAVGASSREQQIEPASTSPASVREPSREEQSAPASELSSTAVVAPDSDNTASSLLDSIPSPRFAADAPLRPVQDPVRLNTVTSSTGVHQPQTDGASGPMNAPVPTSRVSGAMSSAPGMLSAPSPSLPEFVDDIDYSLLASEYAATNPGPVDLLNAHRLLPMSSQWPASGSEQSWTGLNPMPAPPSFSMYQPDLLPMAMPFSTNTPPSFANSTFSSNFPASSANLPSSSTTFTNPTYNFPPTFSTWDPIPPHLQPMTSGPHMPEPSTSAGVMPIGVPLPGTPLGTSAQPSSASVSRPSQPFLQHSTTAGGTTPGGAVGAPPQGSSSAPEAVQRADRQSSLAPNAQRAADKSSDELGPPIGASNAPSVHSTSPLPQSVSVPSPPSVLPPHHIPPSSHAPSPPGGRRDPSVTNNASTAGAAEAATTGAVEAASATTGAEEAASATAGQPDTLADGDGDGRGRPKRRRRAPARPDKSPVTPVKRKASPASAESDAAAKKRRPAPGKQKAAKK